MTAARRSGRASSERPTRQLGRQTAEESRATRVALLDAAAASFAEHGYNGATIADVAERAGVTTGAICRHFDGKEDLLAEASRAALAAIDAARDEITTLAPRMATALVTSDPR